MLASELVHRVAEAIGLKSFHSDTMDADYFRRVFIVAQDVIRTLNQQPDVNFGNDLRDFSVSGKAITFKPYTVAEQSIIDGGGTVDITDRIVDVRPTSCPVIHLDGCKLGMVDASELAAYAGDRTAFAWLPFAGYDVIRFGDSMNATVSLTIKLPITIPTLPTDVIGAPERYHEFIISTIAQRVATILGKVDRASSMASVASAERHAVAKNNATKPMRVYPQISRFD